MAEHKNGSKDTATTQKPTLPPPPPPPDPKLTPASVRGNFPVETDNKPRH